MPKCVVFYSFLIRVGLTVKAPITVASDDSLYFFIVFFSHKILLDILCETSASSLRKIRVKIIKVSFAAILLGALTVKQC